MQVLAVDDDPANLLLFRATLKHAGHTVTTARNGAEAWELIQKQRFDAVVTDWMMPLVDGMDLVRRIRKEIRPHPVVLMVTASTEPEGRSSAFDAGADDFLLKPLDTRALLATLDSCFSRQAQAPAAPPSAPAPPPAPAPRPVAAPAAPFLAVGIGASTGGPPAVNELFDALQSNTRAAYYVVVHGPAWMHASMAKTLQGHTRMPVHLPRNGQRSEPGHVYVCGSGLHMSVDPGTLEIRMLDTPMENYVKPAVDPLFRGLARAFGSSAIGIVLTGMGRDGALGAVELDRAGGQVFVQDLATCVVPGMPGAVIEMGVRHTARPIAGIAALVNRAVTAR